MPLWFWLIILGIVFLITYDKRSGNLQEFFGPDMVDGDTGKTQSRGDTNEPN
jgi:hypothetical protein